MQSSFIEYAVLNISNNQNLSLQSKQLLRNAVDYHFGRVKNSIWTGIGNVFQFKFEFC